MGMFRKTHRQLADSSKLTDLEIGCGQVQRVPGFQAVKHMLCISIHPSARSADSQSHLCPPAQHLSWHPWEGLVRKEIFEVSIAMPIIIAAPLELRALWVLKFLILESQCLLNSTFFPFSTHSYYVFNQYLLPFQLHRSLLMLFWGREVSKVQSSWKVISFHASKATEEIKEVKEWMKFNVRH